MESDSVIEQNIRERRKIKSLDPIQYNDLKGGT